ncbi:hypothetical protein Fmac_018413 [Flemingia macrophylla]|uniref:Transmembrane protein n=1 Tax=Flemingia macrophylla TaxID=520843 RepID=A0ABD1M4X1_9FABA
MLPDPTRKIPPPQNVKSSPRKEETERNIPREQLLKDSYNNSIENAGNQIDGDTTDLVQSNTFVYQNQEAFLDDSEEDVPLAHKDMEISKGKEVMVSAKLEDPSRTVTNIDLVEKFWEEQEVSGANDGVQNTGIAIDKTLSHMSYKHALVTFLACHVSTFSLGPTSTLLSINTLSHSTSFFIHTLSYFHILQLTPQFQFVPFLNLFAMASSPVNFFAVVLVVALFCAVANAQDLSPVPSPDAGAAGAVSSSVAVIGASVVLSLMAILKH